MTPPQFASIKSVTPKKNYWLPIRSSIDATSIASIKSDTPKKIGSLVASKKFPRVLLGPPLYFNLRQFCNPRQLVGRLNFVTQVVLKQFVITVEDLIIRRGSFLMQLGILFFWVYPFLWRRLRWRQLRTLWGANKIFFLGVTLFMEANWGGVNWRPNGEPTNF